MQRIMRLALVLVCAAESAAGAGLGAAVTGSTTASLDSAVLQEHPSAISLTALEPGLESVLLFQVLLPKGPTDAGARHAAGHVSGGRDNGDVILLQQY